MKEWEDSTESTHFQTLLYFPAGVQTSKEEMVKEVIQSVRDFVGPVAFFKTVFIVPGLPKVRVFVP